MARLPPTGPAFTVMYNNSKNLRIPRRFVLEAQSQYGDWFGQDRDWLELSAVDDPSCKFYAEVVLNERRGTIQIEEGFDRFAEHYALRPGNCLRFTLVAASEMKVEMCNDLSAGDMSEEEADKSELEEGEIDESTVLPLQERRPSGPTDDEVAQREGGAQTLLQLNDKKRVGPQKLKRALQMAIRKRHGRSPGKGSGGPSMT